MSEVAQRETCRLTIHKHPSTCADFVHRKANVLESSVDGLLVRDAEGASLRPFSLPAGESERRAADPLSTILAAPTRGMSAGEAWGLTLWGPEPSVEARLYGLRTLGEDSTEFAPEGALLTPETLLLERRQRSLASRAVSEDSPAMSER